MYKIKVKTKQGCEFEFNVNDVVNLADGDAVLSLDITDTVAAEHGEPFLRHAGVGRYQMSSMENLKGVNDVGY